MGNTIILTRNHPSDLDTVAKAEAFQISLLGGPTGEQRVKEQHGWWNEQNQKAEWLATTFEPDTALPFDEARNVYHSQIARRALEGFVHARSYSFIENKFVYHDLRQTLGFEQAKTASSKP
jgi:hypothetical protein